MKIKILKNCSILLKCSEEFLNNDINKVTNTKDKEKLLIFKTYYDFLENKSCLNFLEKAWESSEKKNVLTSQDDLLILLVIVLKSFLEKKNILENYEIYVNSDEIFNYITEQFKFYLITNKKYMTKKRISTTCLHLLDILVKDNIITQKIIHIWSKPHKKTIKFYSLLNINYIKKLEDYMIFSYDNFELIEFDDEYFITTHHYSKTYELYKKNFRSNKSFKLKNLNYILNKINVKLYVDENYQKYLKLKLKTNENEIYNLIRNNIELINKLFLNENWTIKTKEEIAKIQSENSKLLNKLIYNYFCSYSFMNNNIYFPIFLDFRGRKYYYSKIGPTSSKTLRLCYYYGEYNQSEFNEKNNIYSINYYNIIEKFCVQYNISNDKKYFETYYWILIGIGKFFVDKNEYPIKPETFLNQAIKNYENEDNLEIHEIMEIFQYKSIIQDITKEKIKKRAIMKDATASINQIFMKKLGPLEPDSLNYVNLGNKHEWYDTYSVCKDLFYDYIKDNANFKKYHDKKIFNKILPRMLTKNSFMIIPYGAGNDLCWENYKIKIIEKKLDIIIDKDLKKLIYEFFNFIRHDMQELYLYSKTSTSLINKISEEFETLRKYVLESETGEADISYYKMKKSSIDKKYKINGENKRVTKLVLTLSTALDKEAFDIAVGANTIHFFDADEIRIIENKLGYCIITIHDSYLIDFNNCSKLIQIKLEHYQKQIDKITPGYTLNNMFILL